MSVGNGDKTNSTCTFQVSVDNVNTVQVTQPTSNPNQLRFNEHGLRSPNHNGGAPAPTD